MSCVEAVEAFKRGWQRCQVFSRQLEPVYVGMVVRSESVGLSGPVQFDMTAQDIGERPRLQKLDDTQGAFVISRGIFNQQPARQKEISREKNPRSVVVECHVRRVVSGRRNCIHSSSAQIDRCNPIGPVSEAEEMFELPPNL
jgi:hypothetical protein